MDTIYEAVLSQPMHRIKKTTKDLRIWNDKEKVIRSFLDSGATVSIAGRKIIALFSAYQDVGPSRSIQAGGMDAESTGKYYKVSKAYNVPFEHDTFNFKKESVPPVKQKRVLTIWDFSDIIPDDFLIIGRDGYQLFNIKTICSDHLKRMVLLMQRKRLFNTIPEEEDVDDLLQELEYRHKGDPGIYAIADNSKVRQLKPHFATRSSINEATSSKTSIDAITLYSLDVDDECHLKSAGSVSTECLVSLRNDEYEYAVVGAENASILYIVEDENIKNENEYGVDLTDSIDRAALPTTTVTRSNGTVVSYPKVLDDIRYDAGYSSDEIIDHKLKLASKANVFATSDYDLKSVRDVDPFCLWIKDSNACKLESPCRLNAVDAQIMKHEMEMQERAGLVAKQNQSDPSHIIVNTSRSFVVYRDLGASESGEQIVKARVVNNFKPLNDNTYDLLIENQTINELFSAISFGENGPNSHFVSTDMAKWFWQIALNPNHWRYAALSTPFGAYICKRVGQGMKNAPKYAHHLATEVFSGVAHAIQDDLYGGAQSKEGALEVASRIVDVAFARDIKLRADKTYIGFRELPGLGKLFGGSERGLKPLQRHTTKALRMNWSDLQTKTDMLSFAGMVSYIGRQNPMINKDIDLLKDQMLSTAAKPKATAPCGCSLSVSERNARTFLVKSESSRILFDQIQNRISSLFILFPPDDRLQSHAKFLLIVDVSGKQMGASLMQQKPGLPAFDFPESPSEQDEAMKNYNYISFWSRKLKPSQQRYGATMRECLGIYEATKHFQYLLSLRQFDAVGDCRPLRSLFNLNHLSANKMLLRWQAHLCLFSMRYVHRDGAKLRVTDYCSRYSIPTEDSLHQKPVDVQINAVGAVWSTTHFLASHAIPTHRSRHSITDENQLHAFVADLHQITKVGEFRDAERERGNHHNLSLVTASDAQKTQQQELDWICSVNTVDSVQSSIGRIVDAPIHFQGNMRGQPLLDSISMVMDINESDHAFVQSGIDVAKLSILHLNVMKRAAEIGKDCTLVDNYDPPLKMTTIRCQIVSEMFPVLLRERDDHYVSNEEVRIVQTRKQRERERKLKNSKDSTVRIAEHREYLLQPTTKYWFATKQSDIIKQLAIEQRKIYGPLFQALLKGETTLKSETAIEDHYSKLLRNEKLFIRDEDGLLMYRSKIDDEQARLVVPPEVRSAVMQDGHVEGMHHRGISATAQYICSRYYWPLMRKDIDRWVSACFCKSIKGINRNAHSKDKGPMSPRKVVRQNEKLFIDLFGPMHDGFHVLVMVDLFDSFLVLERVSGSALSIVKAILFRWIYRFGFVKKLYSDRGNCFVADLCRLFCFVFGVTKSNIVAYSPWINISECQMKALCKGITTNKMSFEWAVKHGIVEVNQLLDRVAVQKKFSNYADYLPSIEFAHNNSISQYTGFSPNQLRLAQPVHCTFLEMNLRVAAAASIEWSAYCTNKNEVDYAKFAALMTRSRQILLDEAFKNRHQHEESVQRKYNAIPTSPFIEGDAVMWKPKDQPISQHKLAPSKDYGWIVDEVIIPGKFYRIRNVFDAKAEPIKVHHAHIHHIHRPLWSIDSHRMTSMASRLDSLRDYAVEDDNDKDSDFAVDGDPQ